ncbi:MAG TPA: zf-HC2 domain-containing protein, partial [Armatimonadota bacterium]|nr:zf-HC2 domain-containing protein [Armatimonadota bacterium]
MCNEARPIDLWGEFMGCQGYQRSFTAYLDGELAQGQREAIERHVQRCAECRRDLETLRQTVRLLRSPLLPMEDAPEEVRARLTQKLRAVRQPMSWWERVRLQWRV